MGLRFQVKLGCIFVCRKRHIKVERGPRVGGWVVYGVDVFGLRAVEGGRNN